MPGGGTPTSGIAVRIQLVGSPTLFVPSAEPHILERRDAALLALLAIDGPTPRMRAAALLWPEAADEHARNNLRQRIFRLRRAAGQSVVTGDATLALAGDIAHDLGDPAPRLAEDSGAAAGELLGALSYEDGSALAEWIAVARQHWRLARRNALAETASQLEAAGHIARALPYVERLVADDPLAEHAHRRLMRLHYLRGDRAAALAAFERCRVLLARELGAAPGSETLGLAALVESSGALPAPIAAPPSVTVLRPPRIVGRDAEFAQLAAAWRAQQVIIVRGEAGIGKTRLLSDFAAAQSGVHVGGARPGDERVPYATLARLLRDLMQAHGRPALPWMIEELARVLPELGAVQSRKLEPVRLAQAACEALAGWRTAGLSAVCLDDLHYADEASLEALFIAIGARGIRWLLGMRANEAPARFAEWLARTESESCATIALGPLSPQAVRELLHSLAIPGLDAEAWTEPLARHTGGNPMFILETLRALLRDGGQALGKEQGKLPAPANIGQLIERRLSQLSPAALKLARVAAIAGQDFSADLAAAVLQQHPLDLAEAWRELESAQVIRDNAFAHDLILEAAQKSVPRTIARVMNRDIAVCLEARAAPAARVAVHWYDAQDWGRAGAAYTAAANDARRLSRRAAEVEHWHRAGECFDRAGAPDRAFDARSESVETLLLIHGVERVTEVIDTLLRDAKSQRQRVTALNAQAMARLMAADHVGGTASARQAYELAATLDSPWPRFEAARLLAVGLAQNERAEEALPVIEPFRDLVERDGSIEQRGKFWTDYAYVLNSARRLRRTADALLRAIGYNRTTGDYGELSSLTSNYAVTLGNLGRGHDALEQALHARSLRMHLGDTAGPEAAAIDLYVGMHSGALGRYRDALASLDIALECFARDGQTLWIAVANNHRATFLLDLGQVGRAQKALEYATPSIESVRARRSTLAARIERRLGRSGQMQSQEALDVLGESGDVYITMLAQLEVAMTQQPASAVQTCARVLGTAEQLEYLGVAAKARFWRARHLLRADDRRGALTALRDALSQLDEAQPVDMLHSEAWWIAYEIFDAAGESAAAARALQRAVEWIEQSALPHVPDEYCDSFLNRNPVNRAILTTASRRKR